MSARLGATTRADRAGSAGHAGSADRAGRADHAVTVVSYNLWEHRAAPELPGLVDEYRPDALVVQEAFIDELPLRLGRLSLVTATTENHLGLALYVDSERFQLLRKASFRLSPSLHDRIKGTVSERVSAARLIDRRTGGGVILGSVHVAPFTDSNRLRRRQIAEAHDAVRTLGPTTPTLLAGDYNYPLFARGLVRKLDLAGLGVARSDTGTYRGRGLMRGVFDLATVDGFTVDGVETLPQGASDHHPILIEAHSSEKRR